jgi:hypothetical protein
MSRRDVAAAFVLGCGFLFAATNLVAQNACQKDEIFGGYSWLAPNGWGDLDYKINNIPNAFDASNTYYLPSVHNLGLLIDGSGHLKGDTTPPNLANGSDDRGPAGWNRRQAGPFLLCSPRHGLSGAGRLRNNGR